MPAAEHAHILVVDDNDLILRMAVSMLEELGYLADAVNNAMDALQFVMRKRYDAVITDITMPGMDGYQLAEQIHAIKPEMSVICATGNVELAEGVRHCDVVLRKPYQQVDLLNVLGSKVPRKKRSGQRPSSAS